MKQAINNSKTSERRYFKLVINFWAIGNLAICGQIWRSNSTVSTYHRIACYNWIMYFATENKRKIYLSLIYTFPIIMDRKIYTFLPILQLFSITDLVIFESEPTEVDFINNEPLNYTDYELKLYSLGKRISFCLAPLTMLSKLRA